MTSAATLPASMAHQGCSWIRHVGDPNQVAISRSEVGITGIKRPRGFSAAMGIAQGFVPIGATSRFARCTAHHSHWHNKCIAGASAHPSTTVALQSSNWLAKCPRKTKHPSKAAASCRQSSTVQMPALSFQKHKLSSFCRSQRLTVETCNKLQQLSAKSHPSLALDGLRGLEANDDGPATQLQQLKCCGQELLQPQFQRNKTTWPHRYMKYLPVWVDDNKCMQNFMMRPIRDIRGLKKDLNSAGSVGSKTPIIWALQPRQHHLHHPHQKTILHMRT